jgi:hypothetical protein
VVKDRTKTNSIPYDVAMEEKGVQDNSIPIDTAMVE